MPITIVLNLPDRSVATTGRGWIAEIVTCGGIPYWRLAPLSASLALLSAPLSMLSTTISPSLSASPPPLPWRLWCKRCGCTFPSLPTWSRWRVRVSPCSWWGGSRGNVSWLVTPWRYAERRAAWLCRVVILRVPSAARLWLLNGTGVYWVGIPWHGCYERQRPSRAVPRRCVRRHTDPYPVPFVLVE